MAYHQSGPLVSEQNEADLVFPLTGRRHPVSVMAEGDGVDGRRVEATAVSHLQRPDGVVRQRHEPAAVAVAGVVVDKSGLRHVLIPSV